MDSALSHLLAFPAHPPPTPPLTEAEYDKQAKAHCQTLSKITLQRLAATSKGGEHPLDVRQSSKRKCSRADKHCQILNPSINSISYLRVLIALATIQNKKSFEVADVYHPGSPLWAKALDFINHFDPIQTRYSGTEMRCLIEATAISAIGHRQVWSTLSNTRIPSKEI